MINKKQEQSFQEKYKDRFENMGKGGVNDIMKTTDKPIQGTESIYRGDSSNLQEASRLSKNCKNKF
jgi:hypothetical protein